MHLYVIRHGVAEEAAPDQHDAARPLTPDGEKKFRREVKGLRRLGWTFDRIFTSPWVRAKQTAALLDPLAEHDPEETILLAQPPTRELMQLIADTNADHVAIVGHEPWLTEVVQWLALGDPHRDTLVLKKGGIVWLQGIAVPAGMKLQAILPPRVLRALH
ncbi:MAG: phosphohistidine phosphatase SixA [Deltaproteobacteria bacterium]|nr:phosphohistidine phosphatase SixA [Deltaproteobacteria bacterium]